MTWLLALIKHSHVPTIARESRQSSIFVVRYERWLKYKMMIIILIEQLGGWEVEIQCWKKTLEWLTFLSIIPNSFLFPHREECRGRLVCRKNSDYLFTVGLLRTHSSMYFPMNTPMEYNTMYYWSVKKPLIFFFSLTSFPSMISTYEVY